MPNYDLICNSCDNKWEIFLPFKDFDKIGKSISCPCCKKRKTVSVSLENTDVRAFVYQEPKTVGHQAIRNTEKMSKYELESRRTKEKEERTSQKKARRQALQESGVLPKGSKLVETEKIEKPWFGELPKEKAKKIFSGTPKEQSEKVKKYIEKGE
jgi:hypothetical protein